MTKPMPSSDFVRLPLAMRVLAFDGLSGLIDAVAEQAPATHGFPRYQWSAAALPACYGQAQTLIVEAHGAPLGRCRLSASGRAVPGSDWPFRSFPAAADAPADAFAVLADRLARAVRILRIGPVYDDDPAAHVLIGAAQAVGAQRAGVGGRHRDIRLLAGAATCHLCRSRPYPPAASFSSNALNPATS